MPIATREQYLAMLDGASTGGHALAAINVTSSETLNGAMRGFAEAGADGIVQVTTGAADFLSGGAVADMALGARALAEYAHVLSVPDSLTRKAQRHGEAPPLRAQIDSC